jgi:hypothetical protein
MNLDEYAELESKHYEWNELRFSKKDLQEAFKAGISFEHGEQESWKTYNKFTGNQQPNKELNFEEWFNNFKK